MRRSSHNGSSSLHCHRLGKNTFLAIAVSVYAISLLSLLIVIHHSRIVEHLSSSLSSSSSSLGNASLLLGGLSNPHPSSKSFNVAEQSSCKAQKLLRPPKPPSPNVTYLIERTFRQPQVPPLDDILDDVRSNDPTSAQFLLDYAIIGNGKCGTTSLQQWLAQHPQILSLKHDYDEEEDEKEALFMSMGSPRQMMAFLWAQLRKSRQNEHQQNQQQQNHLSVPVKQGYKSPGDIRVPWALAALAKYFPKTVLMVGIRHPVWWFQSLYNFKVQNIPRHVPANYWGDPNKLIGKCTKPLDFHCVGTNKGLFHVYLAMLGKTTNTSGLHEKYSNILGRRSYTVNLLHDVSIDNDRKAEIHFTWWSNRSSIIATPNPVFLFDIQQLHSSRSQPESTFGLQFRRDVQSILGLDQPLGPPPKTRPGKVWDIKTQQQRDVNKMDICLDKYMPLRNTLMATAREASDWILHSGFLNSPDVHVSSQQQLEQILAYEWTKDPCVQSI